MQRRSTVPVVAGRDRPRAAQARLACRRRRRRARRRRRRGCVRRLVGGRALRDLLQERVHFSLDVDDHLGLGELACGAVRSRLRSLATSDIDGPPRPPSLRPNAAFNKPWRCWRRQSVIRLEYRPSRRKSAPFSPDSVQASYSARMASLYSGVNTRRTGLRSGRPLPSLADAVVHVPSIGAVDRLT